MTTAEYQPLPTGHQYEVAAWRKLRVKEMTAQGFTAAEIAARIGTTPRQVVRIRTDTKSNVQPKAPLMSADEIRAAGEYLDDGWSYGEVARTLGRCARTIAYHFPDRGWPRGEGSRLGLLRRWTVRDSPDLRGWRP